LRPQRGRSKLRLPPRPLGGRNRLAGERQPDALDVGVIVRSHHERWDGTGYPDALAGEDIPVESRIIACCDAWNAMRTDRSYRKALTHEHAVEELTMNGGTQFDPGMVAALLAVVAPGHASTKIKTGLHAVDATGVKAVHGKPVARRGRKARGLARTAR
jgi:hypothetical protein